MFGIKKYQPFLIDNKFTIRTDSRCLKWLRQNQDHKSKLMRWALRLQEYDYEVEHIPGKDNGLADFISRHPDSTPADIQTSDERCLLPERTSEGCDLSLQPPGACYVLAHDDMFENIAQAQLDSPSLVNKKLWWEDVRLRGPENDQEAEEHSHFNVFNNLLWHLDEEGQKLMVPDSHITRVISHFHDKEDAAHPGMRETSRQIRRRYHHPDLRKKVELYVKNCLICSSVKSNKYQPHAPLKPRSPQAPFHTISVDVMGPYPLTLRKNRFIIIVEDLFTKWTEAFAVPEAPATVVTETLEREIFARYGNPHVIISDNGSVFISNTYQRMCRERGIQVYYSPVHHQRANPVERKVQELKKILRALLFRQRNRRNWDKILPQALAILRSRENAATGMSPSKALLGFESPRIGEWNIPQYRQEREEQQVTPQERRRIIRRRHLDFEARNYPRNPIPPKTYEVGERVMVKETRNQIDPFAPTWTGPHVIAEKISNEVYAIDRNGRQYQFHVDLIRPAPNEQEELDSDQDDDVPEEQAPAEIENLAANSGDSSEDEAKEGSSEEEALPNQEDAEVPTVSYQPKGGRQVRGPTIVSSEDETKRRHVPLPNQKNLVRTKTIRAKVSTTGKLCTPITSPLDESLDVAPGGSMKADIFTRRAELGTSSTYPTIRRSMRVSSSSKISSEDEIPESTTTVMESKMPVYITKPIELREAAVGQDRQSAYRGPTRTSEVPSSEASSVVNGAQQIHPGTQQTSSAESGLRRSARNELVSRPLRRRGCVVCDVRPGLN